MLDGGSFFFNWIVTTTGLLLQKEEYPYRECLYLNYEGLERMPFTFIAIVNCELKDCGGQCVFAA
jgi:hypothetical protein